MQSRIEYMEIAPDAMKPMFRLEKYLAECGLEPSLLDLIKLQEGNGSHTQEKTRCYGQQTTKKGMHRPHERPVSDLFRHELSV